MTLSQISCTKVSSLQVSCQLLLTHDSLVLHLLQQEDDESCCTQTASSDKRQPEAVLSPEAKSRNFSAKLYSPH